jgi:hypothetical protein
MYSQNNNKIRKQKETATKTLPEQGAEKGKC